MAGDFHLLPKGTLNVKLSKRSPLMLRMIVLAAVMMCSIYVSSICLKQISMPASTRTKPVEKHFYVSENVGLKQTEAQIMSESDELSSDDLQVGSEQAEELESTDVSVDLEVEVKQDEPRRGDRLEPQVIKEEPESMMYDYDTRVNNPKQNDIQIKPESESVKPTENSFGTLVVSSEQVEELENRDPSEDRYDPGNVGFEEAQSNKQNDSRSGGQLIKPESMWTKPMEEHSNHPDIVGLNQTDVQINSDKASIDPTQHTYDARVMNLKQNKIQIKPQSGTAKPNDHSYVPHIDGDANLKGENTQTETEESGAKPTEHHSRSLKITGVDETTIQVRTTMPGINLTQPHCQDPRIPESELPYVHYPVPTNYSRGRCACTPVRSYVIVSMQRSGSKWLESLLNSHPNVSANGEIFIVRERSANVSVIKKTFDKVFNLDWRHAGNRKFCTAAVGFKWMLNQGILENHEAVSKYFKQRGVSLIFLYRRNLLRRLISLLANRHGNSQVNGTHKAHVQTQNEANILASYTPKVAVKYLVPRLKHATARAAEAKEHFKSIRSMDIYYEDLVKNTTGKLAEILDFLRLPPRRLSSTHVKIHTRPLSQMVRNWSAVRRALKGTQFQSFLDVD